MNHSLNKPSSEATLYSDVISGILILPVHDYPWLVHCKSCSISRVPGRIVHYGELAR